MDTIKDRIEYLGYGRATTLQKLNVELGFPTGTLENCDRIPLTAPQLEAIAKRLNSSPAALMGERIDYTPPRSRYDPHD
jgi:hypothetical protein